jgi:hypothetical protein
LAVVVLTAWVVELLVADDVDGVVDGDAAGWDEPQPLIKASPISASTPNKLGIPRRPFVRVSILPIVTTLALSISTENSGTEEHTLENRLLQPGRRQMTRQPPVTELLPEELRARAHQVG